MGYFLGFLPDVQSNTKIRMALGELGRVFDGQSVAVRWAHPESYHLTLLYLGKDMNFLRAWFLKRRLKKLVLKKFSVTLDKANIGISRSYKELVYISILNGGDEIRDMLFDARKVINAKEYIKFIPHISLGRISKDLSNEEFRNLTLDVRNINKVLNLNKIRFNIDKLCLIKSEDGAIEVLQEFLLK